MLWQSMLRALLLTLSFALAPLAGLACTLPADAAALRGAVLAGVNGERARAGLAALMPAPALESAAQTHACDMARRGRIGHRGGDWSGLRTRLRRAGYPFAAANENVAVGHASAGALVAGWMASPGHRANILSRDVAEFGLGVARGAEGRLYWAMVAARRR